MREPLPAGSVPGRSVHVEPSGHGGGGKWEREAAEGCGSPGLEQTASSPRGLSLCRGPYGAVFHSWPWEIRFGSSYR